MIYRHTIAAQTYVFADLRDLMAKATPPRSGDRLAGVAAESAEQMIAARMALAELPLSQFLQETVVPYEDDEVTRLIIDSHDSAAFAVIASLTVGGLRDWLLSEAATPQVLRRLAPGITPEMAAAMPASASTRRATIPRCWAGWCGCSTRSLPGCRSRRRAACWPMSRPRSI